MLVDPDTEALRRSRSELSPTSRRAPTCPGRTRRFLWPRAGPSACAPPARRPARLKVVSPLATVGLCSSFMLKLHEAADESALHLRQHQSERSSPARPLQETPCFTASWSLSRSVPPIACRTEIKTSMPALTKHPLIDGQIRPRPPPPFHRSGSPAPGPPRSRVGAARAQRSPGVTGPRSVSRPSCR